LSDIYNADRRWQNMCEMLDRLGLDAEMLARGRLANDLRLAVRTCQSCEVDHVCQDWLARAPEWIEKAPTFCRNAELFSCTCNQIYGGTSAIPK